MVPPPDATPVVGAIGHRDRTVLVVEDDRAVAAYYSGLLQKTGLSVRSVYSGHEALTRAREGDHSALLLDVRLPDISGIDVLRHLRANGDVTPTLVVTAYADSETEAAAIALGAALRHKPFVGRPLTNLVESLVALGSGEPRIPPGGVALELAIGLLTRYADAVSDSEARNQLLLAALFEVVLEPETDIPVFIRAVDILKVALVGRVVGKSDAALRLSEAQDWRRHAPNELVAAVSELERSETPGAVREVDVARSVGLSRGRVSALFGRVGIEFRTWRRAVLVRRALPGVLLSDDGIAQVAYRAGYRYPHKLTEHIGALFGLTPGELRQRYRDLAGRTNR